MPTGLSGSSLCQLLLPFCTTARVTQVAGMCREMLLSSSNTCCCPLPGVARKMGRKGSPEKPVENSWHKSWKRDPHTGSPVPKEWSSCPNPAFIQTEYSLSPHPDPLDTRCMPGNLAGHLFTGARDGWAAHPATPSPCPCQAIPGPLVNLQGAGGGR